MKATIFKYVINNTLLNNTIEEHGFSDISTSAPRKKIERCWRKYGKIKKFYLPDKTIWVAGSQD